MDSVRVISERVEPGVEKRVFTISRAAAEESEFFKNAMIGICFFCYFKFLYLFIYFVYYSESK